jgi:cysteine desulfurase
MLPFFTELYENSGSSHLAGLTISEHLENATYTVSRAIGAKENEIIFTSGATEAINLALKGFKADPIQNLITASTEHKAILDTVDSLQIKGRKSIIINVGSDGIINFDDLKTALSKGSAIVSIMLLNNETGVLNDIKKIAGWVHEYESFLLCDATQAVGKIPVNVKDLGIDLMPFSAHKFHGPKGVGGLYISSKIKKYLRSQITGGGQQNNLRSGTLNIPGIIGMAKALEISQENIEESTLKIRNLRDDLEFQLLKTEGSFVNGSIENRIFNTTNICFPQILSEKMILALKNISVSSGSACSAITSRPSHVLKAMGLSDKHALSSIRFSLSKFTTKEEIDYTAERIREIISAV